MSPDRNRRTTYMQLRPQPVLRYATSLAEDDDDEELDNYAERDRASPTPSAFSSSSLSSAPSSNQQHRSHMDSPGSTFSGLDDSGGSMSQHHASSASHGGGNAVAGSSSSGGHAHASGSGSGPGGIGMINLSDIFVLSSDPSTRPRGSLTALVHRGQSHPVSRGMPKKKRNKCTNEQLAALEEFFLINRNPTGRIREELSKRIRMPERSVQVWFQNKRAKIKTGDPKPDAEILASYADVTNVSPITQLALAGIAARNKQLQLSTPAPPPPPPPQKTAEALPAFSLSIGTWRRLNPTLVIFFALKLQTFVSYVRSDSLGYKLDIPIQSITRLGFTGPDAPTQVEAEEGLEEAIGRFTIEVNRAPTFFMEVFRSTRDGDANNKPSWRQCSDFTQDRQATKETVHHICGPYAELKKALANVVNASEMVRSKMSTADMTRILGPDPPMPMQTFQATAPPPLPYLLQEQAQHYMSYPSNSMMGVSMGSHGQFHADPTSAALEGASSDTIMPRHSWRLGESFAASSSMSAMHPINPVNQAQVMGQPFDWYSGSSTGHSSNSQMHPAQHSQSYAMTVSPGSHTYGTHQQLPMSLHGRSGSISGLHGSPSFATSYSMAASGSDSISLYDSAASARPQGSRSTSYYSSSSHLGGAGGHAASGSSAGPTNCSTSSLGTGATSSLMGTPQTSMSSLSGPVSESGRSFSNHFASGFVGLGIDMAAAPTHDGRVHAVSGESDYSHGHAATGPSSQQHHQEMGGSQNGFMMPPRVNWSEESSGFHSQQPQPFGHHPQGQSNWNAAGASGIHHAQPTSSSATYATQQQEQSLAQAEQAQQPQQQQQQRQAHSPRALQAKPESAEDSQSGALPSSRPDSQQARPHTGSIGANADHSEASNAHRPPPSPSQPQQPTYAPTHTQDAPPASSPHSQQLSRAALLSPTPHASATSPAGPTRAPKSSDASVASNASGATARPHPPGSDWPAEGGGEVEGVGVGGGAEGAGQGQGQDAQLGAQQAA